MERCTSEYMPTVPAGLSVICLFSSKEFEEKSGSTKILGFFSNKLSLDIGISSYFFIVYFILPMRNSPVKTIFIPTDEDSSPMRRYIFRSRNFIYLIVLTSINLGCTQIKTTEKLFPSDLWLILLCVETITPWRFHIRPYAKREFYRDVLYFVFIVTKTTLSAYQHHLNPFMIKLRQKALISLQNSAFRTSKQLFTILSF